tara:strand:- start:3615 stop:4643 length:1029 start_codon:yes stop_codon:yes gene_type:complete
MKPESVVRKDDLLKSIFGDDDVGPSEGCNPVIHEDASDISPVVSEAEDEEDGGVDTIFGNKSHRGERTPRSDHEIRDEVNTFLARMELATEQDRECVKIKQPAIHKLRMLNEVTDRLKNVDMHELFLRHGLLNVLASWLSLLPDHSLPNTSVRSAVIDAIATLPIETDMVDRKEQLKSSGLGRLIMFLSQLPEETPRNRKKCKELVEKWSRPVYELSSRYSDKRDLVDDEVDDRSNVKRLRGALSGGRKAAEDDLGAFVGAGPKYGEAGYRHHAVIPEPEAMDYIKRPKLMIDPSDIRARTQSADQQRVKKLVGKVAKKKDSVKKSKACVPSVEGRGMVSYH